MLFNIHLLFIVCERRPEASQVGVKCSCLKCALKGGTCVGHSVAQGSGRSCSADGFSVSRGGLAYGAGAGLPCFPCFCSRGFVERIESFHLMFINLDAISKFGGAPLSTFVT